MTTAASVPLHPETPPPAAARRFDLVEVMRHDAHEGIADLSRHLDRMRASAEALGFRFDRHDARNELQAATFGMEDCQVRLLLAPSGAIAVEVRPLPAPPEEPVAIAVAPLPEGRDDPRLLHRTTDGIPETATGEEAGAFDLLLVDAEGFVARGGTTTPFVEREGVLLTPPGAHLPAPRILRERLIEEGSAREADLTVDDLRGGFLVGNSVLGLVRARLAGG